MIRRHKVLYNASAAGNGDWVRLDSRYEIDAARAFTVSMNALDTVDIEGTVLDEPDAVALAAVITSDDIVVLESYTGVSQADGILLGNYTFVRAVKTGVTASAKVQGYF